MTRLVPLRRTSLGVERRCFACAEWWPQDDEFWYFDAEGKVLGRCKGCWVAFNRARRKARERAEMDLAEERDPSAPWNTAGMS